MKQRQSLHGRCRWRHLWSVLWSGVGIRRCRGGGDHVFSKKRRSCKKCKREVLSSALSRGDHVASQLTRDPAAEPPPAAAVRHRPHPRCALCALTLIAKGMASWFGDHLSSPTWDSMLSVVRIKRLLCLIIVTCISDVIYDIRQYIEKRFVRHYY